MCPTWVTPMTLLKMSSRARWDPQLRLFFGLSAGLVSLTASICISRSRSPQPFLTPTRFLPSIAFPLAPSLWRTEVFPHFSVAMATLQQERKRGREREEGRRRDEAGDVWTMLMLLHWSPIVYLLLLLLLLRSLFLSSLAGYLPLLLSALLAGWKLSLKTVLPLLSVLLLGHLADAGIQGNRGDVTLVPHVNTNIDKYSSISKRAIMGVMAEASLSDPSINNAVSLESRRKSTRLHLNPIEFMPYLWVCV